VTLSILDYTYVQKLLLERAAIQISSAQEYLVRSRLEPLAKQAGLADLPALVEQLRREPYGPLHSQVVEAMTTNETSFFRDVHPFETLKNVVIPEITARKGDRTLRVWSGACSTGQEPYSLSMLLADSPHLAGWRIQIIATDLSRATLSKAQQGCYSALEVGRGLPARMLATHFDRAGTSFQVKAPLRALIEWRQLNLAAKWGVMPMFDIVFMRNVLIYFPLPTVEAVLKNVRASMHPFGYLFLGTTENMLGMSTGLESTTYGRTTVYRPNHAQSHAQNHAKPSSANKG
jgi:chemotaxis protein methyltransferase CheR